MKLFFISNYGLVPPASWLLLEFAESTKPCGKLKWKQPANALIQASSKPLQARQSNRRFVMSI